MALNISDCFNPLQLVSLLVLHCPILSANLILTSWSIHLGDWRVRSLHLGLSQPCLHEPSPGSGVSALLLLPQPRSQLAGSLSVILPSAPVSPAFCLILARQCLSLIPLVLCPCLSPKQRMFAEWMNDWTNECIISSTLSHSTSVSVNLSLDLWGSDFLHLHLKRGVIYCHEGQRKEILVVVIWLSHRLPDSTHIFLLHPLRPPPAQQQRVRSVSPPQEGAFAGSSKDLRMRNIGAEPGVEGRSGRGAPRPGVHLRVRSAYWARRLEEGDGGGNPRSIAPPRPLFPGPEDVLLNGQENPRGNSGLDTVSSPHLYQPSDFQGYFHYFPTHHEI